MNLNEYQEAAVSTAIYPFRKNFLGMAYCALKLNGEAGEVAEHIGKSIRDDNLTIDNAREAKLVRELGDCLWYIAVLADELGYTLEEIAKVNVEKLADRQARGVLGGSGDNR